MAELRPGAREFAPGYPLELIGILVADSEQGLIRSLFGVCREIVRLRPDIRYLAAEEDGVRREKASRGGENNGQSFESAHKSSSYFLSRNSVSARKTAP
jgi:hypothetical protein